MATNESTQSSEKRPVPQVRPEDRVPVGQKVAYGLGSVNDMWGNWLYPGLAWPVFNIFLHVNPKLVSIALMVNRLIDAVSDPLFGWLSDNTRSRWGRRRPYILIGSILAGLCLPGLFLVGTDWQESSYFIYMLISSGIYITIVLDQQSVRLAGGCKYGWPSTVRRHHLFGGYKCLLWCRSHIH